MGTNTLEDLIERYSTAQGAWREKDAIDDRLGANPDEWRAYQDATFQIIEHRCSSLVDVSRKAEFIVSDESLFDIVHNGCDGDALKALLMSMVLDAGLMAPTQSQDLTKPDIDENQILDEVDALRKRLGEIIEGMHRRGE